MILRTTSISRLASTFVFRTPVNYMDISVLDLFKFNAGADATKQLDRRNSMEPSEVCHPYMWDLTCFRLSLSSQQHPDQFLHDSPQLAASAHAPLTRSPPQQFAPGIPVSMTAQDLLNVLGLLRKAGDGSKAFLSLTPAGIHVVWFCSANEINLDRFKPWFNSRKAYTFTATNTQ